MCVCVCVCAQPSVEFGSPISGYEVEWGSVGGVRHTMSRPQSPCMASLTHLSPDTEHTARIKVHVHVHVYVYLNKSGTSLP